MCRTICTVCNVIRNITTDAPFLEQELATGRAVHFCSTACMLKFWNDTSDPDNLLIKGYSFNCRTSNDLLVCYACFDFTELENPYHLSDLDEDTMSKEEYMGQLFKHVRWNMGEYHEIYSSAQKRYEALAGTYRGYICSASCHVNHLKTMHAKRPYDAKAFWEKPKRQHCTTCKALCRYDDYISVDYSGSLDLNPMRDLPVKGDSKLHRQYDFCSSRCFLKFLANKENHKALVWVPHETLLAPIREHAETIGDPLSYESWPACTFCSKISEGYVAFHAPYESILCSDNGPNYCCTLECLTKVLEDDRSRNYKQWYPYHDIEDPNPVQKRHRFLKGIGLKPSVAPPR